MLRNASSSLRQHPVSLVAAGPSIFSNHVSTSTQILPSAKSPLPPTGEATTSQATWSLVNGRIFRKMLSTVAHNNTTRAKHRSPTHSSGNMRAADGAATRRSPQKAGSKARLDKDSAATAKPLLRPYHLSQRLRALCKDRKYDEAITTLQNAPLDAQNAVVWNSLIAEVMAVGKLQLGYRLYIDMKRRGLKPTGFTYSNLLKAYRDVEDWGPLSKQLDNVHNIFQAWREHVLALKESDPKHPDLCSAAARAPLNMYISILGTAQLYQKMLDVFNDAYENGPVRPNAVTYSHLLTRLADRQAIPGEDGTAPVFIKNAADARFIWRQMCRDEEKGLVVPDAICIHGVLRLLAHGRASDQLIAFDIIRDYVGLAKPGETPLKPRVELTASLLSSVLLVPLGAHKHKICIHFLRQVMDRPIKDGEEPVLDSHHIQLAVSAYVSIASFGSLGESRQVLEILEWSLRQGIENPAYGHRLRPTIGVYRAAFTCFWRAKDWASMMRAFELMSGYIANDFSDHSSSYPPKRPDRSSGKSLAPDNEMCASMARTALDSGDQAIMRQCLRIFDCYEIGRLIEEGVAGERVDNVGLAKLAIRSRKNAFYEEKLAEATAQLVDAALNTSYRKKDGEERYIPTDDERARWLDLRAKARAAIRSYRESPKYHSRYVPRTEQNLLGSEKALFAMDRAVERKLDNRLMESV